MALAQAAVHSDVAPRKFLLAAEQRAAGAAAAGTPSSSTAPTPMPSILDLLDAVRDISPSPSPPPNLFDLRGGGGMVGPAWDAILEIAGRVRVDRDPEALAERTAEMYHAAVYEGAAAALARPDKEPKWDFFLM